MNCRLFAISLAFCASPVQAFDASRVMPELTWEQRVLLIFSPHGRHADYRRQVDLLGTVKEGLSERDLTVIEAFSDDSVKIGGQAAESGGSGFYRRFSVGNEEFRVILVGKDGTVKLDRSAAVEHADLFSLIDAMPMRRMEMQRGG